MNVRCAVSLAGVTLAGFLAVYTPPAKALDACIQVITCACNDTTGECREFPTPCDVPPGWTIVGYTDCPVAAGSSYECLDVISYARNPDTGECVEFPTSCTPPGWERCSGGA